MSHKRLSNDYISDAISKAQPTKPVFCEAAILCPTCKRRLKEAKNKRENYCPRCGQRIGWELAADELERIDAPKKPEYQQYEFIIDNLDISFLQ